MRTVARIVVTGSALLLTAASFTQRQRDFWSFQKIKDPAPPAVHNSAWARTPIDRFILAKLEAKNLRPAPPAEKVTLLRRATLDLIGLPPSPEEVDAFVADQSPDAFEKVVDRLLASPHYGERWGRHWLDLARYAESEGFKADETRPNAWRYRDYVIQSFNQDKPYDRFVQEQLAGDELWPNDPQARVATAFNRHYPDESNARVLQQRRQEILDDITDATGAVFTGLTFACARCHDHKFDPILQADYFRLQAFFANTAADDHIPMLSADEIAAYREKRAKWEEQTAEIRAKIAKLLEPQRQFAKQDYFEKYPPEIQAMILKPPAQRTPYEWQMAHKAQPYLEFADDDAAKSLKGAQKDLYASLKKELAKSDSIKPAELPEGIGMKDLGRAAPPTHLLAVGVFNAPKEEVQPGFLTMLDPTPAAVTPIDGVNSTGRRTALARWLTNPENPLTARVMVNRIWHHHFGKGIVGTPSDFGFMGERPSHPELLDWLAREFVRSGWSMKHMHRLIMTSAVYRQSSAPNAEAEAADPRNRLLAVFPMQRLEGEAIRDSSLYVAGALNTKIGGPSVFPDLPTGMNTPRGGWKLSAEEERNRRSVYIFVRRNTRYPMLDAFDMPDSHESCSRRNSTVTAPQALALLNDRTALEWARAFAARALKEQNPVDRAYRLVYSRPPDSWEKDTVATFLEKQKAVIHERAARGEKLALPTSIPEGMQPEAAAAFVDFCQMLLNSNEFVYRN
ncbi:MAG TPA: DUF1549 and DUF1553 domain-containing protein [Bryobacteraceae bacterium]|jgi:hypothetical protein|nr:DUF1549 and DUF1553 domain-containing protein [Bryobacteraceae bacterium]